MRDKKVFSPPLIGASSLLVIFSVLCLTVFALLSISTVRANQRLSDHSAQAVTDYYQADCIAEQILAQLRSGIVPEGVTESNGIYSYSCPISDTQVLKVDVSVSDTDYTILRWQAVSCSDWQADTSLPVWTGEFE